MKLGTFNLIVNLAVSTVKSLIVMAVFMHLSRNRGTIRLAAAAGFFRLTLLIVLSLADFLTRPWS